MLTISTLLILGVAFVAGVLGSLLGLGGGFIVVPALSLFFGVPIHAAIGASIVGVVATSSGAASRYVRQGLTHMRLAMLLEVATVSGALGGALLAGVVSGRWLFLVFAVMMLVAGASMVLGSDARDSTPLPPDRLSRSLRLEGSYVDRSSGHTVEYRATRTGSGLIVSLVAGIFSGLLGLGGGFLKVPAMHRLMRLPIKVCTATSTFMIGVTAATSAAIFFTRGDVRPELAAPVAVGVLAGAALGSRLLGRLPAVAIRRIFLTVLVVLALQMAWKGLQG
jgi:uncharacterized membrane protein YfcA